jgi:hypothetical protein
MQDPDKSLNELLEEKAKLEEELSVQKSIFIEIQSILAGYAPINGHVITPEEIEDKIIHMMGSNIGSEES